MISWLVINFRSPVVKCNWNGEHRAKSGNPGWGSNTFNCDNALITNEPAANKPHICINVHTGCVLFQNLTNLDRSRFVRWDRSSPVKKNARIFQVAVGVVILFSSAQSAADHTLFHKQTGNADARQHRWGVAKSDFLRFVGAFRSDRSRFIRFWKKTQPLPAL